MKKKIFLFICILLFTTACSDYEELENLAYVTSIGIDYINDEYNVTYEILNSKKGNNKVVFESYTVDATDKSISNAFLKAAEETKLYPYFAHTVLLLIDENVAKEKLEEINDFIIRENEVREFFYFCVTKNAKETLNTKNEENPVVANAVKNQLEINKYSKNEFHSLTFDQFINNIENFKFDNAIPFVSIDNDKVEVDKMVTFKNYKLVDFLDKNHSYIYNLFKENDAKYYIAQEFSDKIINAGVVFSKKEIDIKDNKININILAYGEIINNETDFNMKNSNDLKTISESFENTIKEDVTKFIKYLQENNLDFLEFKNKYYIKNRKDLNDEWLNYEINVNVDFKLAKKGIIYDSLQNNKK